MPIKNLTDRESFDVSKSRPRFAVFRKGAPKPEGRPGADLEHFRVEFAEQFEWLEPQFKEMFPEPIVEVVGIALFGHTTDQVFPTWMQEHNTSRTLMKQCDGETIGLYYVPNEARWEHDHPLPCQRLNNPSCDCKQRGRLLFTIPAFNRKVGIRGMFELKTSSKHELIGITNTLRDLEMEFGKLSGIPFVLGRAKDTRSAPTFKKDGTPTGKRIKSTKSFVYLYPAGISDAAPALPEPSEENQLAITEQLMDLDDRYKGLGNDVEEVPIDFSTWGWDEIEAHIKQEFHVDYQYLAQLKNTYPEEWDNWIGVAATSQAATVYFAENHRRLQPIVEE